MLKLVCAMLGVCILIPIVGIFSALDSRILENRQLRAENQRLRRLLHRHGINPTEKA